MGMRDNIYMMMARERRLCISSKEHEGPFVEMRNILGDKFYLCMQCFASLQKIRRPRKIRSAMKMDADRILKIVIREMCEYGSGWRADWSDFDGRELRKQLYSLAGWAEEALEGKTGEEYVAGTEFSKHRWGE